ncbi:MAG: TetR/AcrR family transcriptional regulator [Desulfobacterales bacterium]|nr:TetR/AcrR family transcriptional regulator [Desulfobacterales bacterium]
MRTKDEEKKAALFEATVKTVNEMGFASASVSKITKEAGVSPATLYIYHKNKEELLVSTYITIEKNMSRALLEKFNADMPLRDILENVWVAMSDYFIKYQPYTRFAEQFANSPYKTLVNKEMVMHYYAPIIDVLQQGIDQKIIKNVDFDIIIAFICYPLLALSNPGLCSDFEPTAENIKSAFALAWDAIKL